MFAQFRQQHLVFQAALIILMLSGSDGARIMKKAPSANAHQQLVQSHEGVDASPSSGSSSEIRGRSESATWLTKWGGGHDVCRPKDLAGTESVDRYHHKMEKVKTLAAQLEEKACGMSCPQKWVELKSRMQHFMSCAELLEGGNGTQVPQGLQEAMTSGEDSLLTMQHSSMGALSVILEKYDFFPKFDDLSGCRFNPAKLDMMAATASSNPEGAVREQLFGSECNDEAAKEYMARLKGNQQRIATRVMEQATQVLALGKKKANNATEAAEESKDIIAKLTKQLEESEVEANEHADELMTDGALLEVGELSSLKFGDLIGDLSKDSEQSLDVSSGVFKTFLNFLAAIILIYFVFVLLYFLIVYIFLLSLLAR